MNTLPKARSKLFEYEPVPSLSTSFDSDNKSYISIENINEIHRSIVISNTGEDSFKIIHDIKELTIAKDENQLSPNRRRRKISTSKDKKLEEGNKILATLDRIKFEVDIGGERRVISIEELVRSMFNTSNGIVFKNKKYHLKTYKSCFQGNEAVLWMRDRLGLISSQEAVIIGQLLQDNHFIRNLNDGPFLDEYCNFKFHRAIRNRYQDQS